MRGDRLAALTAAMVFLVLGATAAPAAGVTGEAACGEFLTRKSSQSLFLTVQPPQPVLVQLPPVVSKKKKKKKAKPVFALVQPQYVDVQVGCTAASGDGDVADGASVSTDNPNQTLVVDVLSSGDPAGRCDPGPLGQLSTEMNGDRTVAVKLATTCNYRSFGGGGQGPCAKCYQVRVRYENIQK